MRRAAVVVLLGVALMLWLGLLRMRDTVEDELAGARQIAQLSQRLSTLQALDDAQARAALQAWQSGGTLRHLQLQVLDAQGATVLAERPAGPLSAPLRALAWLGNGLWPSSPAFVLDWALPRGDGAAWRVHLRADPDSERLEALTSLLEGALLLAAVGMVMLLVMAWNTRRAFRPLQRLVQALQGLAVGRAAPMAPLPAMPIAELETIAAAVRHLDAALREAERARQRLAAQLVSLQEDERARLARELHDEFGQQLTALRVNAAWLARRLADQPEALAVVQQMAGQCSAIQQDIRAVLGRLRPLATGLNGEPATLGALGQALQALVQSWQQGAPDGPRWRLQLDLPGAAHEDTALPADLALTLYRISQEALTNVARHAAAREAALALSWQPGGPATPAQLHWSVSDDGVGGADRPEALRRGNGLAGLKERVWAQGGDLQIGPATGDRGRPGTRLSARFNVPALG